VSYCRWENRDSDCYIFLNSDGFYECMVCPLGRDPDGYMHHWLETAQEMLDHMHKHVAAGHRVPDYAIDAMREDVEREATHGPPPKRTLKPESGAESRPYDFPEKAS